MPNPEGLSVEELDREQATELPGRDLLLGVSILGLPLASLDGLSVNVDTSGPNWLAGSIGSVA